jgi:asparagine synthase (glutamine-hydrolysing)
LCFASEVKALLTATPDVHEVPPGHQVDGRGPRRYAGRIGTGALPDETVEKVAAGLRRRLNQAVARVAAGEVVGAWLSGGLDSSSLAALARPHARRLHTFAAGMAGAPDLEFARAVADHIGSDHDEVVVGPKDLLLVLPAVIYHLESFDALLVRSSLMSYLVSRAAANCVGQVLSGEAGDELFAGYHYLKSLDPLRLPDELVDITERLHNTALQRVDRCASAFGVVAHVPFADPDVVSYAFRIPAKLKLRDGVEKWILRQAMTGLLPGPVLNRTKAKIWQGAGVGESLAAETEIQISDRELELERTLPNGWLLSSKEELLYYRIFRERFGDASSLDWMGRTKVTPS